MAKKFDLGDYLRTDEMSRINTGTEQIVYIDLDRIDPDPNNFYSLDGIDELAGNIELIGLQQPLRVRPEGDRFTVISGHRRRAACLLIRDGGSEQFSRGVPCIVEYGEATPAMRELRLIYANSSTRVLSPAELSKQAERVQELLYELKKQGVEFPGRMREHVAAACRMSESKLARLAAIRKNLVDTYRLAFDAGRLPETHAYRISQETPEVQKDLFEKLGTAVCSLTGEQLDKVIEQVKKPKAEPQEVSPVRSSFDAEAYLAERAEEDDAFFEMLSEEADPFLRQLGTVNSRQEGIQMLKECLGRDRHSWLYDRVDVNCSPKGVRLWDANGDSDADITRTWTDVYDMLCTIALNRAALGIGRADPEDEEDEDGRDVSRMDISEPEWMTGEPERDGRYLTIVKTPGALNPVEYKMDRTGGAWLFFGEPLPDGCGEVVGWWPLPKEG